MVTPFLLMKFEEVTKENFLHELKERTLTNFSTGKFSTRQEARKFTIEKMSTELLNKLTNRQVASPEQLNQVDKLVASFFKRTVPMKFEYVSVRTGHIKSLPKEILDDLHKYLSQKELSIVTTLGELQNWLLEYKAPNGEGLMIHQLNPIFVYCGMNGKLWDNEEIE